MTSPFDAAIIDLDGTMVDTLGDFEVALNRMLADFDLPPVDRNFIELTVGRGSEHLIRTTLDYVQNRAVASVLPAQRAIKTIAIDAAWQSYQRHYQAVNGACSEVYAGVREGLDALRAEGLPLACLTNEPTAFALPLLEAKGLRAYFTHVFGGDAFARKTPDPLPLLKTCEALGTAPTRTLMVGDSSNDALAARAAGCPVALVTYGYNHGQPIEAVDCDLRVPSLAALARHVCAMDGKTQA